MAEAINIKTIDELTLVHPFKDDNLLSLDDFLVVYEGHTSNTNKVSISSLKDLVLNREYSIGIDPSFKVDLLKRLIISKDSSLAPEDKLQDAIAQVKEKLPTYFTIGEPSETNKPVKVTTIQGNAISYNDDVLIINKDTDTDTVVTYNDGLAEHIVKELVAGSNINFSISDSGALQIVGTVQEGDDESSLSETSFNLKLYNVIQKPNDTTGGKSFIFENTTDKNEIKDGSVFAVKFRNTPVVSGYTIEDWSVTYGESPVSLEVIYEFAIFCKEGNKLKLLSSDRIFTLSDDITITVDSLDPNCSIILLRNKDKTQEPTAIHVLTKNSLTDEYGNFNYNKIEKNTLVSSLDLNLNDINGLLSPSKIDGDIRAIVINGQDITIQNEDELVFNPNLDSSASQVVTNLQIQRGYTGSPEENSSRTIYEVTGLLNLTPGFVLISFLTGVSRVNNNIGLKVNGEVKNILYKGQSTSLVSLPVGLITEHDSVLFYYNGTEFLLLSIDDAMGDRITIGEDENNNIILYQRGNRFIVNGADASVRGFRSISSLLSVSDNRETVTLNFNLPSSSDTTNDYSNAFLNGKGEWVWIEEASKSLAKTIPDIVYPVGSVYFTEKNITLFDPNGPYSSTIQDNIIDWTSDGTYLWTHSTEGNVHKWTKGWNPNPPTGRYQDVPYNPLEEEPYIIEPEESGRAG